MKIKLKRGKHDPTDYEAGYTHAKLECQRDLEYIKKDRDTYAAILYLQYLRIVSGTATAKGNIQAAERGIHLIKLQYPDIEEKVLQSHGLVAPADIE